MNTKIVEYPPLETERIKFRILTLDNAEEVFMHFSDSNVTKFMDIEPCKHIKEAEEIIQYHMEDSGCRWGMYDRNSEKFIGTIGFYYLRKNEDFIAEVGFDLCKDYWGKGLMSEAMKEVISFGFTEMGLDTIDATVDSKNQRSINLMRKLGFKENIERKENLLYFDLKRIDKGIISDKLKQK
ncbi:GNAT family N-acetyltransferase [Actinomycetes bacterium NPDC127524]